MKNQKFLALPLEEQCKDESRMLKAAHDVLDGVPLYLETIDGNRRPIKFYAMTSHGDYLFQEGPESYE